VQAKIQSTASVTMQEAEPSVIEDDRIAAEVIPTTDDQSVDNAVSDLSTQESQTVVITDDAPDMKRFKADSPAQPEPQPCELDVSNIQKLARKYYSQLHNGSSDSAFFTSRWDVLQAGIEVQQAEAEKALARQIEKQHFLQVCVLNSGCTDLS